MDPRQVLHPQGIRIENVLYDSGIEGWSLAELTLNGSEPFYGIRWNGETEDDLGMPTSRNDPVWFYLPEEFTPLIHGIAAMRGHAGIP